MAEMKEVRWHGRGGQGAKTASYILAVAAAEQGWQVQAFPEYGAERRGAPMKSYVRMSHGPIRLRSGVREPSVVVVLDSTLLSGENVATGVPSGGLILINGTDDPGVVKQRLGVASDVTVGVVDASTIAMEPFPSRKQSTAIRQRGISALSRKRASISF